MPTRPPVNSELMNLAAMPHSLMRDLNLGDTDMSRVRVYREWIASAQEYEYIIREPGRPTRRVTTAQIIEQRESRTRARREAERPARVRINQNADRPGVHIENDVMQFDIPRGAQGATGTINIEQMRVAQEVARMEQVTFRDQYYARPWGDILRYAEPELPAPAARDLRPTPPDLAWWDGIGVDEARSMMSRIEREVTRLRSDGYEIATIVVNPQIREGFMNHLSGHRYVEPLDITAMATGPDAPVTARALDAISRQGDLLLGYRLIADDATDTYQIAVKPTI